MFDVSIVPCVDYSDLSARRALESVLEPIDGLGWVKPGMKIVIKANLVSFMKPESAATTHPALLCALTQMLTERGASVIVGDSPGGIYTSVYVNRVYSATGMKAVEKAGACLNQDYSTATAAFPEALVAKHFQYTAYLDKCDAIIDFCKLKSHGMMSMSAAVKNMFGAIPGTVKPEYHYRFPNHKDFANMLIDLNEYFVPKLSIADAVVAMEGNGPTQGKPRQMGALLASFSPHKLDLACAKLMGLGIDDIPTLSAAFERGFIPETAEELSVSGNLADFAVSDFDNILRGHDLSENMNDRLFGKTFSTLLRGLLSTTPKLVKEECIGCQECLRICPAKAIEMKSKKPVIDRKKCIRCFCCQEFCPKGAMKAHRSAIARLLSK